MLRYRDFIPKVYQAPSVGPLGIMSHGLSEPFDAAVQAAGNWIRDHRIQVMHLETVVLTSAGASSQSVGTAVPAQPVGLFWEQFLRVWYDDEVERPPYR